MAVRSVDARTVKSWLSDGGEIAFVDVREHGQYGEGHPFLAVSVPYSRFEPGLVALVPNPAVRLVLMDGGDGVAERAAQRAEALGYSGISVMSGGAPGWAAAGYTLFAGVNVPSKTFGELVEHRRHTPRISATELRRRTEAGDNIRIFDGRTFAEFRRMSIPGGVSCPNGEMALHLAEITADPDATIVVNCAGRTRSIIGAETLITLGVTNPVLALENGTQGWFLAGLDLERGAKARLSHGSPPQVSEDDRDRARALALRQGAGFASAAEVQGWLGEAARTTVLIDVRTQEEHVGDAPAGIVHAPGGQLIQATDQWVGVRGARLVLIDSEMVRAPVAAGWLAQLGHEVWVLEGGMEAARSLKMPHGPKAPALPHLDTVEARELATAMEQGRVLVLDLRPGMSFRRQHVPGATWSIRPRLSAALSRSSEPVVLVADDPDTAQLAVVDLKALGAGDVRLLQGGLDAWTSAGLAVEASPDSP
ncbi:MAG: rhodanese-like domain-containing protein, partial [Hyphomicrobiaceae bacterium]